MRICSCSSQEATRPSKCRPCSSHNSQGPSQGHTHPNEHSLQHSQHIPGGHTHLSQTWRAHSLSPGRPGPSLGQMLPPPSLGMTGPEPQRTPLALTYM